MYEELDDIDELLQDVDSAIVYEYVTHTCTCVDKCHDVAQGWRSLVFDKSQLNAPSSYALLVALIPTRRALLCSSFLKMLSLGRHGLFKSRGLETSGEVQPRILKFAQSISQRIVVNLSQWCPNKCDKSKTDTKAECNSSYLQVTFF